jgi:glycosyltransferase involved in cell wall biosynthesis
MKQKLVSIIMPAFNAANTIEKSIESVLNQTYKDWELIVINDGSTDNTNTIVKKLIKKEKSIRLITLKKNIGSPLARDEGIKSSNGRWIAFLDADDLWLPKKLEVQIAFHKKSKVALSYTQYRRINKLGHLGRIIKSPSKISYEALLKSNVIANSTALIDRQNIPIGDLLMNSKVGFDDYHKWLTITRNYGPAAGLSASLMLYFYNKQTDSGNKFRSIHRVWWVYRDSQKLSLLKSLYYTTHNALNGLIKHSRF